MDAPKNSSSSKLTEKELAEIRFYFENLKKQNANVSAHLPFIMQLMGQCVSLDEEKKISDEAKLYGEYIDFETVLSLINKYWKDSSLSFESAIRDLDQFNSGVIKLDYFHKIMSDYGEPLEVKELNELVKFLFKDKTEITCGDAVNVFINSTAKIGKSTKKKKKPLKAKKKTNLYFNKKR